MMNAWLVNVRTNYSQRYTDSVWIEENSANLRVKALTEELNRVGHTNWRIWATRICIQDAIAAPNKLPNRNSRGHFQKVAK